MTFLFGSGDRKTRGQTYYIRRIYYKQSANCWYIPSTLNSAARTDVNKNIRKREYIMKMRPKETRNKAKTKRVIHLLIFTRSFTETKTRTNSKRTKVLLFLLEIIKTKLERATAKQRLEVLVSHQKVDDISISPFIH